MNTITTDLLTDIVFTLIKHDSCPTIIPLLLTNTYVNHIGRNVVQTSYRTEKYRHPDKISPDGKQTWLKNGVNHRDWDFPAIIFSSGTKWWFKNGERHRIGDLPACVDTDGSQWWYKNGEYHRDDDLPAIINTSGDQWWYQNGKVHRDGDLPAIVCGCSHIGRTTSVLTYIDYCMGRLMLPTGYPAGSGSLSWYKHGKRHRDGDEPAIIKSSGAREWYKNGERHRDGDEPAIIESDGTNEWYKNGERFRDGNKPTVIHTGPLAKWFP